MRQRILLLLLLLNALSAWAQVPRTESFETEGNNVAGRYTSNTFTQGNNNFSFRSTYTQGTTPAGFNTTSSRLSGIDGSYFWASEGVKNSAPLAGKAARVQLTPTTITGFNNLKVTVLLADPQGPGSVGGLPRWERDDTIRISARVNGGTNPTWVTIGQFVGDDSDTGNNTGYLRRDVGLDGISTNDPASGTNVGQLTTTLTPFTFDVIGTGTTLDVRIDIAQTGNSEEFAFDKIMITGTASTNVAPVLANIEGTSLTYNEGFPATVITSNLTVSDADNTTLTSARVRISGNFNAAEDVLAFTGTAATGNIVASAFDVTTGTLTLTSANSTATLAQWQNALRAVTYQNTDIVDASELTRTVGFSVTDPAGNTTAAVTRTITINTALDAASTPPYIEDFTTDGEGTRYASNDFTAQSNTTTFRRTNVTPYAGLAAPVTFTNISPSAGSFYFYGSGVSNPSSPNTPKTAYWQTKKINATTYANLQFQIRLGASSTWLRSSFIKLYYRTGNGTGPWVIFSSFRSTDQASSTNQTPLKQDANPNDLSTAPTGTTLTTALQNFTFALPAALNGQIVDFRLEAEGPNGNEELAFDLVQVSGTQILPPTVTTATPATVTTTSAVLGGNVTADGGATVTERGVVYSSTNTTPTTADTKDTNGNSTGSFSETISGLTPGTRYYVRAYAINSAGTAYGSVLNFTTTPTAPVVTAPANGSIVNTTTPTYLGTALANSTVTVSVDGVALSTTTTANATGDWTLVQPTALAQGSHTVRATAAINGSASSANSNTNTFTVDAVRPTVVVSSTAGASGSTTNTSPIPFTVTFSETVTGFVAGDVTVGNGTISAFSGSGASYSFNVTPTTPGTVTTVNVPASVAQDAAGNFNTTATQFSITYNQPSATVVSVTRLTPSPTATTQVSYRVVFSASVTGITVNNFNVTTSGLTGTGISSVVGSGSTYTVAVNTGTGSGTLRLNVQNSTGMTPTVTNVPYTSGEQYTITKSFAAAPQLTLRGAGSASGSFNDVTAFVDGVQVLQGGTTFAAGLSNSSFETNNVGANGFQYAATVVAAPWTFSGNTGVSRNNSGFGSTAAQGDAVGILQTFGGNGGSIAQNLAVPTGSYQVNFQTIQRNNNGPSDQVVNVFLNDGTNDVFLGTIEPLSNSTYTPFTSATFAVTAPALTATISSTAGASGSTTGVAPIPFTVTFSQSATGFTASDVTVGNGTVSDFSGSGTVYTFNVNPAANGAVTVNVPANSAVDANNTGNTAATQFTINYLQPVTAAPVVTAPANGSLINTATPTYTGTAPAGSTVRVYVDGTTMGSVTANGTGNWSITQTPAITQGSHTVYATAQTTGSAVSANSNTNTFTVDAVRPAVAISSSAGASGSTTNTSPIPFTVTFSETVTGFVAGDITVNNGTISGFSGSGTTYTFNVTPATPGAVTTVNVPANVSQDAAGNFNTAATQFSITLASPAVYTSSTADHPTTQSVLPGSTNQVMLRLAVTIGGGTGTPLSTQSLSFTTTGTTAPADIDAARVYYTGTSGSFATTTPFGSAVANPNGAFAVTGTQQLATGVNYFWLVYDVAANGTAGNVLDATVPSLTISGTVYNPTNPAPTGNRQIVRASRVAGTALRFVGNATPGYADFSASTTPAPLLNTGTNGAYSQVAWIKPAIGTGSTNYYVLGNGIGNSAAPYLYVTGNGRVGAGFGTGTATVNRETSPNTITSNEWHHVAATYNGSTLTIYLDGESVLSTSASGTPTGTRVNFVGNVAAASSANFPGDIDEISQWTRTLPQAELRRMRHLTLSGTETNLVSYLQFNDNGTTTTDIISNAVGTLTGATRVTSTAAVGSGTSNLQVVAANTTYPFAGTNVSMAFTGVTGSSETVVFRLDGKPLGTQPTATGLNTTYTPAYWIVDKYAGGTFTSANVTYTLTAADISAADAATPANLKLFKRGSNADGAFEAPISATAANAAAGTVSFPVTSFSQTVIGTFGSSPLPVELTEFTAELQGEDVLLRWATASELNNARFDIESSADGKVFRKIGSVEGRGTTTQATRYKATDLNVARYAAERVYYRLRQVDTDGTSSLSPVRTVKMSTPEGLYVQLYPNPSHPAEALTLLVRTGQAGPVSWQLIDVLGRVLRQETNVVLPAGTTSAPLSADELPVGVYLLKLQQGNKHVMQKLVRE
ncbi:Ig-like domain-containing protein [Hymenobacter sp. BT635]|uniref:Ig-like domain-containing protein n=1 Tax=Hymenobacter nitidus TaxID=2880929 RepID=A0ABS8A7R3_9BACT|nr:Ig-like domain-containing protein [Hymenobacter nitidus]MCB2376442.1 Ig-like domain-containing protein [Hymenobacter nitidus]